MPLHSYDLGGSSGLSGTITETKNLVSTGKKLDSGDSTSNGSSEKRWMV